MDEYLRNVEKAIERINSIDYSRNDSFAKVENEIRRIGKIPIIMYIFQTNNMIFRARINFKTNFFTKFSEISYPKPESVKNYARVNVPNQSRFYGSENRPTSYLELAEYLAQETKIGETISITIGGWMVTDDLKLILVYNPKDTKETEYNKHHKDVFSDFLNKIGEKYKSGTVRLYEFLGEKFSEYAKNRKDIYIITNAFSGIVLSKNKADGIIYPSVPMIGKGFNVALLPSEVDDLKIRLMFASRDTFEIGETEEEKHHFKETKRVDAQLNYKSNTLEWINGS